MRTLCLSCLAGGRPASTCRIRSRRRGCHSSTVDAAIIVAVIALVASVLTAGVSLYGQMRSVVLTERQEAAATLSRYREPLVAAAYELQSRLYNILRQDFLQKYYVDGDEKQRQYAIRNTQYLVGQYLGWTEILRRRIQLLDFGEVEETREVARLQGNIRDLLASDDAAMGSAFMVWRGEQRAIGERMIVDGDGELLCMGYADFVEEGDSAFWRWLDPLERDIESVAHARNERLRLLQHALIELIERLDVGHVRFPERIERV
jgi:hypothetical protein